MSLTELREGGLRTRHELGLAIDRVICVADRLSLSANFSVIPPYDNAKYESFKIDASTAYANEDNLGSMHVLLGHGTSTVEMHFAIETEAMRSVFNDTLEGRVPPRPFHRPNALPDVWELMNLPGSEQSHGADKILRWAIGGLLQSQAPLSLAGIYLADSKNAQGTLVFEKNFSPRPKMSRDKAPQGDEVPYKISESRPTPRRLFLPYGNAAILTADPLGVATEVSDDVAWDYVNAVSRRT